MYKNKTIHLCRFKCKMSFHCDQGCQLFWTYNKQPYEQHYNFCDEVFSNVSLTVGEGAVPVENIQVEAGKHAFSWAACRERASSPHHHVEDSEGDEVFLLSVVQKKSQVLCQQCIR